MNEKLKLALRAVVSIAILSYLFYSVDWQAVRSLKPGILAIIFAGGAIFFIAQCIMSLRWKILLDRASETTANYLSLVRTYTIAQFFNLLMPGSIGGDFVRAVTAAQLIQIPRTDSFSIVVSERLFGLAGICIFITVGCVFPPIGLQNLQLNEYLLFIAAFGAVAAFAIAMYLANRISTIGLGTALALLLISAFAQLTDVIITSLLAEYFHLDIGFSELLIVIPIVYFATILPISVGGLGVREGAMVVLLAAFSVDETTAIIMAFSLYLTKLLVGLLGGLLYLLTGKQTYQ